MHKNSLRRDTLDYILTDTTPLETSELFTYSYLYSYLHKNNKNLNRILEEIKNKEVNTFNGTVPFRGGWNAKPLEFGIVKPDGKSIRKMSIPQPLSVLNMYFFISLYQKDILNLLERPTFSVRYHRRNSDLVYRSKSRKSLIDYQYRRNRKSKKVVEQSGRFFDIGPFTQVVDLNRSERWKQANLNYRLFCKLDYKRCFDSVYTHSYKWIVTRDVVDSKAFGNSSLFAVIDRILQNINGSVSNGVIVGPEFSRMIVEILLQQIDREVQSELLTKGIRHGVDYELMRFVDDSFIFTNDENVQEIIIKTIEDKARFYLLEINQLKIDKQNTPYFKAEWVNDVDIYIDKVLEVLRPNKTIEAMGDKFQVVSNPKNILELKDSFSYLIGKYKSDTVTLGNYTMSVLMNNMSSKSRKYLFFRPESHKAAYSLIDTAFYVYCYAQNFKNTQKLISILYYCHNEIGLKSSKELQFILHKYEAAIVNTNYSDIVNLLIAFSELDIHFSLAFEERLFSNIKNADDPIALATFMYYSTYNDKLKIKISAEIDKLIMEKVRSIQQPKEELLYKEFWYVLIFNKCPYINPDTQTAINTILKRIAKNPKSIADRSIKLIIDFMLEGTEANSFISWNTKGARMLEEITYRTHNKTIFRKGTSSFLTSL